MIKSNCKTGLLGKIDFLSIIFMFLDFVIKNVLGLYFIIFPSKSISLPVFLSSLSLKNHKQITSLFLLNSRKYLKNSKPFL